MLRNAGWRAFKLGKRLKKAAVTLKKAAFKNLPIARRRGEAVYRRAARVLGAPKPVVAEDVVVSLTSFPARIGKVHHVVSSLLDQSAQPHKIVLYLSLCEFPDRSVPKRLTRLEGDRFEVRFVAENLRSHKKLQYALIDFPDAWIATADDDRLYPADWLSRLLRGAAESSGTIICMRGRRMIVSEGRFLPFGDWPFVEIGAELLIVSGGIVGHFVSTWVAQRSRWRSRADPKAYPPRRRYLGQGNEPDAGRAVPRFRRVFQCSRSFQGKHSALERQRAPGR